MGHHAIHTWTKSISSLSSMLSTVRQPWLMKWYKPGSCWMSSLSTEKDAIYLSENPVLARARSRENRIGRLTSNLLIIKI